MCTPKKIWRLPLSFVLLLSAVALGGADCDTTNPSLCDEEVSSCTACSDDLGCDDGERCEGGECVASGIIDMQDAGRQPSVDAGTEPEPGVSPIDAGDRDDGGSEDDGGSVEGDGGGSSGTDGGTSSSGDGGVIDPDDGGESFGCPSDGVYCNGVEARDADGICRSPGQGTVCPSAKPFCNEDNDRCDECESGPNHNCDNNNFCDGPETCNADGVCVSGPEPCSGNCLANVGACGSCENDDQCDDQLSCTGIELCLNNVCVGGTPACGLDVFCVEEADSFSCPQCLNSVDCYDDDFCNGDDNEVCTGGQCEPGTPPCPGQICLSDERICVDCVNSSTCPNSAPFCENNFCVECTNPAACDDGVHCNGIETCVSNVCVDGTAPSCGGSQPYCSNALDACVACLEPAHCADGDFCNGDEVCNSNGTCSSIERCPGQQCLAGNNICVECLNNNHCSGSSPYCTANNCVECSSDANCIGGDVCVDNTCVECRAAADCSDGLQCNGDETCSQNQCASASLLCGLGLCSENVVGGCVNCLSDFNCAPDGEHCNGDERCNVSTGACYSTGNPCSAPNGACDEGDDQCYICVNDGDCNGVGVVCRQHQCVPANEENCANGDDDDLDGLTDCDDADCTNQVCATGICRRGSGIITGCYPATESNCNESSGDEDLDGDFNCADIDCEGRLCGFDFNNGEPLDKYCTANGVCKIGFPAFR